MSGQNGVSVAQHVEEEQSPSTGHVPTQSLSMAAMPAQAPLTRQSAVTQRVAVSENFYHEK